MWLLNSALVLIIVLSTVKDHGKLEAARANKHVPFLQEELQLRERQRHRPRTSSHVTSLVSEGKWKADRLTSHQVHEKRTLVDYLKYDAGGDGLNVSWMHNVNGRTILTRVMSGPFIGPPIILEGDVFLRRQSSYTPMMLIPPSPDDAIKFKDWLMDISQLDKIIKVNFKTTEVIRPALQYLFTMKDNFKGIVVLHANIGSMPESLEMPVDPVLFTSEVQHVMPEATVGVGWADAVIPMLDEDTPPLIKYSWRLIFDILEYTYEMRQPVLFSCRARFASYSAYELLWLLSIRDNYALNIFGVEKETILDWDGVVALRIHAPRERVIYDLTPPQRIEFMDKMENIHEVDLEPVLFDSSLWRVVQFINPTALLSTIVVGSRGVAFLGWPTAFLLSHVYTRPGRTQTISGRLLFVPKNSRELTYSAEESGLAIFLLNSIDDLPSPVLHGGIRAFIGSSGRVSLQNRLEKRGRNHHGHGHKRRNSRNGKWDWSDTGNPYASISATRNDGPLAASRLPAYQCYGFRLVDEQWKIRLTVYLSRCSGGSQPFPKSYWSRTISLNVPRPERGRSRHVAVQKTGDASMDVYLENLHHRNCALIKTATGWIIVMTILIRITWDWTG